ncbi:MAG: BMP family ABC transporter substrate-binding protein [Armatimonadetes bacterium]|nr:BMP family ABC transporter substrate-binding protein [Armatimonadota bacterium]MBS1711916.1 BMP family ABC transporter substrate-binding protein [Armatimonadota bacterium]MBX3109530.1 BMP family ABC transporter substrate-binding protein [Fimbriimonadaceae bacterium]
MRSSTIARPWAAWAMTSLFVVGTLGLFAGCTPPGEKPDDTPGNTQPATQDGKKPEGKLKVGIVFDSGGIGDKSFNDSAWAGIQKAEKEFGIEVSKIESKVEKDYEPNLTAMADDGNDLVIAVGLAQGKALEKVAKQYPDTKFAIVDGFVTADNVRMLHFSEEQGSYLVGYIAGKMTKTGKVGFVGGEALDLIKKFQYGFQAGVKAANAKAEILPPKYTGSWENIDEAKIAANLLFDSGADIVYHAAGRAGLGVIQAAKERKKFAIGVDRDQDDEAPGFVLTSMVKNVDAAVYETIKDMVDGKFTAGEVSYDVAHGGVGISALRFTKDMIGPDVLAEIEAIKQKIADGSLKVPSTEAEYAAFKPE